MTPRKPARPAGRWSGDAALGLLGGVLAAASATFGVGMALHGPVAELGRSGNFTVFAQFAPRQATPGAREATARSAGLDSGGEGDAAGLDLTATASIPREGRGARGSGAPTVTLQAASAEAATILVNGRRSVVRVGDVIPGIGAVLAIVPGEQPLLRTTGGMIAAARQF